MSTPKPNITKPAETESTESKAAATKQIEKKKPQPSPLKPGAINLYGVKEAAEYCNLAARTIKYHIYESGELQADALIGHSLVFTQETLDDFIARRRPAGRPKGSKNRSTDASDE